MAGLRFNEEIKSHKLMEDKINLAQFELIPFVLGTAKNVKEARKMLERINLIELNFNKKVSSSRLHYLIADKKECIVIESRENGINIYDNPLGVLTNSPNFPYHLENVRNYLNITSNYVSPRFAKNLNLGFFSTGAGTFSLPGDLTSPSRFIRALFYKNNIILEVVEDKTINPIFKIFDSVSFINGSALCLSNNYEKTIYTGLINLDKNIYYYKTYDNSNISMLELRNYDIHDNKLITIPLNREFKIYRH
jgi:choloylglycine hydrolase